MTLVSEMTQSEIKHSTRHNYGCFDFLFCGTFSHIRWHVNTLFFFSFLPWLVRCEYSTKKELSCTDRARCLYNFSRPFQHLVFFFPLDKSRHIFSRVYYSSAKFFIVSLLYFKQKYSIFLNNYKNMCLMIYKYIY